MNGYAIFGTECFKCDPTCLTCNGELPTDCMACATSKYFIPSDNPCADCNYTSGQCLECDSTCLTCDGASLNNCLSCKAGRYLENSTCSFVAQEFINAAGDITGVTSQIQSVASSAMPMLLVDRSTSAMILVGFLADVGLYKYLNVPFPENFVSFCEQLEGFDPPNIFQYMDSENGGNNPSSTIGKFEFWEVSATLLDNSSFAIARELFTLGIILGLTILVFLFKEFPKIFDLLCKLRGLFMWNMFLSNYFGDFPDFLLNSMIQMRENYVSSAYTKLSFAFAVIIVSSYAVLLMYLRYILNKRNPLWKKPSQRRHSISSTTKQSEEKWVPIPDSLGILVEDFREKSKFARNFILVMLLETFLQILVIFFFQDNGLTQAILYILIVATFFSLSAWKRPYKSKVNMGIFLVNQGSKIVMGIFGAIFGINDKIEFISADLISLMGLVLMLLILIVMGINLLVSLLLVIMSIYERIQEWRSKCKKEHSKEKSTRSEEMNPKKQNFIEEQSPSSSKFEQSSLDLHMDSNVQAHQPEQNDSQVRFRPAPRLIQPVVILEITQRNNESNGHIRERQIENNSVSEIQMFEQAH